MRYESGSQEPAPRLTVKLKSPFWGKGSSAAASILQDGRIQLDLYDFSDEAQSSMGNDVAWFWNVDAVHKPRVIELLEKRSGTSIPDDQALLDALARQFAHVHAVRDWLRENNIPYEEKFDSWA
jgi:hypothetical protein